MIFNPLKNIFQKRVTVCKRFFSDHARALYKQDFYYIPKSAHDSRILMDLTGYAWVNCNSDNARQILSRNGYKLVLQNEKSKSYQD